MCRCCKMFSIAIVLFLLSHPDNVINCYFDCRSHREGHLPNPLSFVDCSNRLQSESVTECFCLFLRDSSLPSPLLLLSFDYRVNGKEVGTVYVLSILHRRTSVYCHFTNIAHLQNNEMHFRLRFPSPLIPRHFALVLFEQNPFATLRDSVCCF